LNAKSILEPLTELKAQRLAELLQARPGQKHYKRLLRAFLDADAELQLAYERQLNLR
jgi:hypothetical protein